LSIWHIFLFFPSFFRCVCCYFKRWRRREIHVFPICFLLLKALIMVG
jgi:hypothetical protein